MHAMRPRVSFLFVLAGPGKQRSVRIRGIAGREEYHFSVFWFRPDTAEHVDSRSCGKLRRSHSGNEHASTNPATIFHGFQRGVDGAVAARNTFRDSRFAHNDSVAGEKLLRDIRAPLSSGNWRSQM